MRKHLANGQFAPSEIVTTTCVVCGKQQTGPRYRRADARTGVLKRYCSHACVGVGQRKPCIHGMPSFCKACKRESEKRTRARYVGRYAAAARMHVIKTKYGLDADTYEALVAHQGGQCAIQDCEKKATHVDHDHATGKVRGLLCGGHNRTLGAYEKLSTRFAFYLENPPAQR